MFDLHEADEYFERHLKSKFWSGLDAETRAAAVNCAVLDVKSRLNSDDLDETDIFVYCAVFEQAVYLAEYFDAVNAPSALVSESVTGVGSRRYSSPNSASVTLAPRAAAFLERYGCGGRISRG